MQFTGVRAVPKQNTQLPQMSGFDGFQARPPKLHQAFQSAGLPSPSYPLPGSDSLSQALLPVTAPDNLISLPPCAGMDVTFSTGEGDAVGIEVASFGVLNVLKCLEATIQNAKLQSCV